MARILSRISEIFKGRRIMGTNVRSERNNESVNINVITKPEIYLVYHTQATCDTKGESELQRFLNDHTITKGDKQLYFFNREDNFGREHEQDPYDMDNAPEVAGRLCYMSFDRPRPGGNHAYLEHIRETGHGSVLEHPVFNFIATGVSRSLTHELVRHRAGMAYSQLSQRFVDHEPTNEDGSWSFVCPLALLGRPKAQAIWQRAMEASAIAYAELSEALGEVVETLPKLNVKQQREAARSVLPNSTETKIFFSANARALRHIFHMRGSKFADREIRAFTRAIFEKVKQLDVSKELFSDVTVADDLEDTLEVKYPRL